VQGYVATAAQGLYVGKFVLTAFGKRHYMVRPELAAATSTLAAIIATLARLLRQPS